MTNGIRSAFEDNPVFFCLSSILILLIVCRLMYFFNADNFGGKGNQISGIFQAKYDKDKYSLKGV